jgi:peptidoglycan/LPS O-acetylase OafA/YrhL
MQGLASGPATRQSQATRYRPEIDGLRAIAVIAVIINHFNSKILPGGYLGVDIFFVIYGYVITSYLHGRPSKDFKEFICGFYQRRIKRLIPALAVFVIVMGICICLFNPDPRFSLRTGIAAMLAHSNLYLLKHSANYFGEPSKLNPFTHTWSLGVEEQFYLIFPFLIWFSGYGRAEKQGEKNLLISASILTTASLVYFLYLHQFDQPAAYYLMPSRLWEMSAGCLVFIGLKKRVPTIKLLEKIPASLIVMLITGVMFLPLSLAPIATIAIILLSSALVSCLKVNTVAFRALTWRPVVYVGLISYSLYLWHWGILSISRWTIGFHWWSIPIQASLMLVLAAASYRLIETPLRQGEWFQQAWKNLVAGGAILATISGVLVVLDKPLAGKLFTGKITSRGSPIIFLEGDQCITQSNKILRCMIINNQSERTLWVIGDSHTGTLANAAKQIGQELHMNVRLFFIGGAPFPSGIHQEKSIASRDDVQVFKLLEAELEKSLRKKDIILLAAFMPLYFGEFADSEELRDYAFSNYEKKASPQKRLQNWQLSVSNLAAAADAQEANIIIQSPTPTWKDEINGSCNSNRQWFNLLLKKKCSVSSSYYIGEEKGAYNRIRETLEKLSLANHNIHIFDAYLITCPGTSCMFSIEGLDIYSDFNHLSPYYAQKYLAPPLSNLIKQINLVVPQGQKS